MRFLLGGGVLGGDGLWLATRGRNLREAGGAVHRRENNGVVVAPTDAARIRDITDGERHAAVHGNFHQLAIRKESKPFSVWREEKAFCAFGAGERLGFRTIERP